MALHFMLTVEGHVEFVNEPASPEQMSLYVEHVTAEAKAALEALALRTIRRKTIDRVVLAEIVKDERDENF